MNSAEIIISAIALVAAGYALGIVVGYTVGHADGEDSAVRKIVGKIGKMTMGDAKMTNGVKKETK